LYDTAQHAHRHHRRLRVPPGPGPQLRRHAETGRRRDRPGRSPGTFEQLTGIGSRRVAGNDEYSSTLAVGAARRALAAAGLGPGDIDLLIYASATRDVAEPATAHIVQADLGSRAHALDVTNACNSFINGIDIARPCCSPGERRGRWS
jgi:acyl-CoA:acyl-CoA alkyltransferase